MKMIKESLVNLNISRYTKLVEEENDLKKVNKDLVDAEDKMLRATEKQNEFLKELSLSPYDSAAKS